MYMEKICPQCGMQMKTGYVQSSDFPVQWIPAGSRVPMIRGKVAKGAVRTGSGGWFFGYRATSYYCENCKLIITPVKDEKNN
jgi:hypothetical protein